MELRDLQRGDVEGMYRLDVLCFEEPFRFSRAAMRRFAGAANALVRLAVEPATERTPERLLGFYIVHLEPGPSGVVGYVVTLDVDPGARGRGVATRLMAALETEAGAAGAGAMALHVFGGNTSAISLYEKLGYAKVGIVHDFYGPGLDAFEYQRVRHMERAPKGAPEEAATEKADREKAVAQGGTARAS